MSFLQYNCTKYPSSPTSKAPSPIVKNLLKPKLCSTPSTISSLSAVNQTVAATTPNGIDTLNINDSGLCTSSLISTSTTNIENNSLSSYDTLFTEADINSLVEALSQNQNERITLSHLMRSASSAGETASRSNQDTHTSMPKRAETFNGASSKETNISLSINGKQKKRILFFVSF